MPLPQQPYSQIPYSDRVRNTNPVGSWSQIHPTTQKYLVENYGVDPKGTNWMQQPFNLRDAVARYPLATVKGMAAQGRLNTPVNPRATAGSANVASFVGSMLGSQAGGMSGLPFMGMSGAKITPVPGGATTDLNKGTVTRNAPMGKQGNAMNEKQLFKAAFLAKCIEDGLDLDEIAVRIKSALSRKKEELKQTKSAGVTEGLATGLTNLAAYGLGASALAGIALPTALGYYGLGPAAYHMSKPKLPSREDLLKEELAREYERQADILAKNTELAKRRKERSKNISGVTRF